jgi:hypothetical protein
MDEARTEDWKKRAVPLWKRKTIRKMLFDPFQCKGFLDSSHDCV